VISEKNGFESMEDIKLGQDMAQWWAFEIMGVSRPVPKSIVFYCADEYLTTFQFTMKSV
jgi:hypothetical protein